MMKYLNLVRTRINSGSERSILAKKNIVQMLVLKGGNIFIGLLLVPLTLHYVDSDTYGIWLTLSSMVAWVSFFDIGINNGLKNNLTIALAHKDYEGCKKLISTTYLILCLIFIPLMAILLLVTPQLNWIEILNIKIEDSSNLIISICIIIIYFCFNFILSTINVVLSADQRPADAAMRNFIQQLCSLIVIAALTISTKGNLVYLCLGLCASPLLVVFIFNISLFSGRYKHIKPSLHSVDFRIAPSLLKLGVQFFVIQIAAIIQYQMINFLIIRYYGAIDVTNYNISYKYFNTLMMIWAILTTPVWAAVTDSIANNDYEWIRNTISKYLRIFMLFGVLGVIMLVVSRSVYCIWVGDSVSIPYNLSACVLIYNLVMMFGSIFVNVINGSGYLKIQVIASCISPIVFFVSFFLFYKVGLGVESIIISACLSNFNGIILAPLQCCHILKKHQ